MAAKFKQDTTEIQRKIESAARKLEDITKRQHKAAGDSKALDEEAAGRKKEEEQKLDA